MDSLETGLYFWWLKRSVGGWFAGLLALGCFALFLLLMASLVLSGMHSRKASPAKVSAPTAVPDRY